MSLYTYDGNKINVWPLYETMEYAQDAQQIERGELFYYVNDIVGIGWRISF